MTWTRFMDMHSGGGTKEEGIDRIYIEAPEAEAKVIFFNRFGHSPDRISCTCCGEDYSISESETLEQASAYDRGCAYAYFDQNGNEVPREKVWQVGKGYINGGRSYWVERKSDEQWAREYIPLKKYVKKKEVLIISTKKIRPSERKGEVPKQGFVWVD